jgi:hypothetical protein
MENKDILLKHFTSCCADKIALDNPNEEAYKKLARSHEMLGWTLNQMRLRCLETSSPELAESVLSRFQSSRTVRSDEAEIMFEDDGEGLGDGDE